MVDGSDRYWLFCISEFRGWLVLSVCDNGWMDGYLLGRHDFYVSLHTYVYEDDWITVQFLDTQTISKMGFIMYILTPLTLYFPNSRRGIIAGTSSNRT